MLYLGIVIKYSACAVVANVCHLFRYGLLFRSLLLLNRNMCASYICYIAIKVTRVKDMVMGNQDKRDEVRKLFKNIN